jgi:thiazole/oxazole-forming peptide maturase SagD family component
LSSAGDVTPALKQALLRPFLTGQVKLLDIGYKGAPVFVFAGLIDYGQGTEFISGASLMKDDAFFRCLFEFAERQSALLRRPDDLVVAATGGLTRLRTADILLRHAAAAEGAVASETTSHFLQGRSMSRPDASVAVPAECVLFDPAWADLTDSNGLAAHASLPQATLAGLLELIERDAVAIWWYNGIRRPGIAPDALAASALGPWLRERERRTHFLHLTADIPVPVVAAVSMDKDGGRLAYGFGAAPSVPQAMVKAACEMARAELSVHFFATMADRGPTTGGSRFGAWSLQSRIEDFPHLLADDEAPPAAVLDPAEVSTAALLAALGRVGIEAYTIDLTRPDIGIPVARVVAPGLRPWWPHFAPGRLFDVPVRLGWLERARRPAELTPVPILI